MNLSSKPSSLKSGLARLFSNLQVSIWSAIILSILICGAISWLHFRQRQVLAQMTAALENMQMARIELAKGFLYASLAEAPGAPFNRDEGLALLQQAATSLEDASRQTNGNTAGPATAEFQDSLNAFRASLAEWSAATAPQPKLETNLRIAFNNLERQADLVDARSQQNLRALSARLDFEFGLALLAAMALLFGICGLVFFAGQAKEKSEAALRRERDLMNRLMQTGPVGITLVNRAGQITFANAKALQVLGVTASIITQRSYNAPEWHLTDYAGQPFPESRLPFAQVMATRQPVEDVRHAIAWPDGRRVLLSINAAPLFDEGGQVDGMVATFEDVTRAVQAETALRESQEQMEFAMEGANDGIWDVDLRTDSVFLSPRGCEMFGYTPAEFQADVSAWNSMVHPDDLPATQAALDEHLIGHTPFFQIEQRLRTKAGDYLWTLARGKVSERAADGRPLRMTGTHTDISARKRAEDTLRESEERYRSLFENMQEGVALCQMSYEAGQPQDFVYLAVNAAFERLTGLKDVAGKPVSEVIPGIRTSDAALFEIYGRVALTGIPEKFEIHLAALQMWFSISVYSPRPEYFVAVFDVITDRKRSEQLIQSQKERLAAQNEELLAQNEELVAQGRILAQTEAELRAVNADLEHRVEARTQELSQANTALARAARMKDEFLASMSHELRTPLTAILGLADVLRMGIHGPLTERQLKSLSQIDESGQHLLTLINDILDVSKIEAGKVELELTPVVVSDLCQASVQFVRPLAQKKQLRLSMSLDVEVGTIQADARRLKQMLVNLLSNAVKFTPEGGQVKLEVQGDAAHQQARFTVSDTGIGIAPDDLEKLFKPFVQLDSRLAREYSGTGLGLSLVMGLAELHGGSVTVESEPGRGSQFSIILPWAPAAGLPARAPDSVSPAAFATVRQTLTVEDSPIASDQLTQYLTQLGIRNVVLAQGNGVVEKAAELRPDVILLDLLLPDISGWKVLQKLKADPRTQAIPVIIVSVVDDRARAEALGVAGYLNKPIALSDLQTALSRGMALAAQRAAPPAPLEPAGAASAPTILLAEDSDYVIASLVDILQAQSYRVVVAQDGSEALNQARALRPDLILMDIQMPGLDGLEVTRRLRAETDARLASVPIIALTALAMPGDRERCLAAGATDYMTKPIHLDQLLQLIRTLLDTPRA